MITKLTAPNNIVAFRVQGDVTKEDYEQVIMPAVKELTARTNELNYLMEIDTPLNNFTAGAWWEDVLLGIKQIARWNRVAILTDSEGLNTFTDIFGKIAPGEFKGYTRDKLDEAIQWVSAGK